MIDTDIYNGIPAEIRNIDNWVLWRYETVYGRPTKVPYQTNGSNAKSSDPNTWTTFSAVVAAVDRYDGIGWCVPDGPIIYCGIDADDAIDPATGDFRVWEGCPVQPRDLLTLGPAEITPSGAGFRVMAKIDEHLKGWKQLPFGIRNTATGKVPGIEMYSKRRFFTFTGNHIPGTSHTIENRTDEIKILRDQLSSWKHESKKDPPTGATLVDQIVLEVLEGRIPNSSRNNLMHGIMGVLLSANWTKSPIQEVVQLLIASFHQDSPAYDMVAAMEKQWKSLDDLYTRHGKHDVIPGFTYLEETLTSQAIDALKLILPASSKDEVSSEAEKLWKMLEGCILSEMNIEPPEFLAEPHLIKGNITVFSGLYAQGKTSFVHEMLHKLVNRRDDVVVIYADADNPASVARDRSDRLRGDLKDKIRYWGGFVVNEDGRSQPPLKIDNRLWFDLIKIANNKGKHLILVFDTLASFLDGRNENDNSQMGELGNCCRDMTHAGATVIVIHHKGKGVTGGPIRGGSSVLGWTDAGWEIESDKVDNEIKSMRVIPWKSRQGKTKTDCYKMVDGRLVPENVTDSYDARIFAFICQHLGKTIEGIGAEALKVKKARGTGYSREQIREAINLNLISGKLEIVDRKVCGKQEKETAPHQEF